MLVNSEQSAQQLLLAEKLAEGLRSQGLEVGNSGTTNLTLAISSAAVTVEEKTFTYVTKSPRQPPGDRRFPGQQV